VNRSRLHFATPLYVLLLLVGMAEAQSASTGAITGVVADSSGAVVSGVKLTATNEASGDSRDAVSSSSGSYLFPLLSPGSYTVKASKGGFKELIRPKVLVSVTETVRVNVRLEVGAITEVVTVSTEPDLLDTVDAAEGIVTDGRAIAALPLASRNYTQIIGLSPGISSEVTDATALGRGTGSEAAGTNGFSAHGSGTNDNNYQVNGVEANDLMGSGIISGGVPVPNPDTIQEFKVQTGQYDASYGRNSGANVDLVTKGGSNQIHGSLFEFFRNDVLNANTYFHQSGQPRGVFKQNQFGGSLGGPIVRDKLFYFGSYQGTRQRNGLDPTLCASNVPLPLFTNDRSRGALGSLFSAPTNGAIAPDGSNISDQAYALLNLKLPNGNYVIPTPQGTNPLAADYSNAGLSTFSVPCHFTEDQFIVNVDYLQSAKSSLSGSYFFSNTSQIATLPTNANIAGAGVPGFPENIDNRYRVVSIAHRYSISPNLVNQATIGYRRLVGLLLQTQQFKFSDIGVSAPSFDDPYPEIGVAGSFETGGNGQNLHLAQNFYTFNDALFWTIGRHSLHFGGGIERSQINQVHFSFLGGVQFPDYVGFLLGNGSYSLDVPGLFDRYYRTWDGNLFAQDNIKITPKFTLNLGFRYERLGDLSDNLGRNSSFDPGFADHTGAGSQAGYVVASNFKGDLPPGVVRAPNEAATRGLGQNTWGPRVGFSWQLPGNDRVVLRGGYGIYYSRTTGQPIFQELTSPPFGQVRFTNGVAIPFATPFPTTPVVLPSFPSYSLTNCATVLDSGCLSFANVSTYVKPPATQQFNLNTQISLTPSIALEVGYQGARGTRLFELRSFNQALSASPTHPVNGATDNEFFNVMQRALVPGISTSALQVTSTGASWYNGMAVSLNKRFSKGLQFLASYTWSSLLATTQNFVSGSLDGGNVVGDLYNPRQHYGWDQFVRPQRFVLSWVYQLPEINGHGAFVRKSLGGWSVAGVTTIQSGQRLTVTATNLQNVFGILTDRAPVSSSGCGNHFVPSGSVQSKLNSYINKDCFDLANYPVIGADGIGTDFGNSPIGEVIGPNQNNWDLSLAKNTSLTERVQLQFRTDFFNAFNHPQFANPNLDLGLSAPGLGLVAPDSTFGHIQTTSTNPRILQFALRLVF